MYLIFQETLDDITNQCLKSIYFIIVNTLAFILWTKFHRGPQGGASGSAEKSKHVGKKGLTLLNPTQ